MTDEPVRRRILTFRGTPRELLSYLRTASLSYVDEDEYEWELTASISRHPAGKRLTQGEMNEALRWEDPTYTAAPTERSGWEDNQ
jgi:hypothetical protein